MRGELPIITEDFDLLGERVTVRAAPYGLAAKMAYGNDNVGTAAEIVRRCCTYTTDGEAIDLDALPLQCVQRLVEEALRTDADFTPQRRGG